MSFYSYKNVIEQGDLVLIFIGRNDIKPITVSKGEVFNTRYGHFKHDDMIGMKYGEQMVGAKGYGFVHLLHPTPELWTLSLPHRTQIVYTHDSAYIMQRLGVTVGTRVIEAGTGSASFTHSFARTIGLPGRLFTYEFHEPRYLEAREEIHQHGLDANTWITHRDVCENGFDIEVPQKFQKNGRVEAEVVFLDLPSPWTAIPHLDSVISSEERIGICCFSPCIEQVDKTVKALEENGWISIEMVEVAGKRWEARKDMVRDVNDVVKRLKDIQSRRGQGIESKKVGNAVSQNSTQQSENQPKGFNPFGRGERIREGDVGYNWRNVTKIEPEIRGHTSYLTFAYKLKQKA